MKNITGVCDICNAEIKWATTQAQFNRNMGLHKRMVHDIKGPSSTREGRNKKALERYHAIKDQPDKTAQRREYQAEWRRNHKQKKQQTNGVSKDVLRAYLSECPCCKAVFYYAKGQQ